MKQIVLIPFRIAATAVLVFCAAVCVTAVSPVFRFSNPEPFSGPDIYNPYSTLDTLNGWKRANFHTHTRVESIFNECDYSAGEALRQYRCFGYDIVAFSNHQRIIPHPEDTALQVNVYEHGYNLFKFHKLVFGGRGVNHFDNILPLLISQKQWQLDYLSKEADFVQMNHPLRTVGTSFREMSRLTSYRIIELDSGMDTEQEYWDWALSAGHYSFGLANDDLHHLDRSNCFAVRCNWVNSPSAEYADLKDALLSGRYYSMRIPDFGGGDWDVKLEENRHLPMVEAIGAVGDSLYVKLSASAKEIKLTGDGHNLLGSASLTDSFGCRMRPEDSYARFTVYFDNRVVIYSNPFARYDRNTSDSPYKVAEHQVNIFLTVLYNLALALLTALCAFAIVRLWHKDVKFVGKK